MPFDKRKLLNAKNIVLVTIVALLAVALAFAAGKHIAAKGHSDKVVALTFDDGPDPRFTPKILDILKKENVKATFFMIGSRVDKNPRLARRVANEGHLIGNHTYTHPDLKLDKRDKIIQELKKCQDAIYRVTGQEPHYFRPPKGLFDDTSTAVVRDAGYKIVLWDVCVEHKASPTPEREAKRVLLLVRPGYIILAHDGRLNRKKTVKAIPLIIKGLKEKGYGFVTVDELANAYSTRKGRGGATALIIR